MGITEKCVSQFFHLKKKKAFAEKPFFGVCPSLQTHFLGGGEIVKWSGQKICSENLVLIQQLSDTFSAANCRAPGTATEILGLCDVVCTTTRN